MPTGSTPLWSPCADGGEVALPVEGDEVGGVVGVAAPGLKESGGEGRCFPAVEVDSAIGTRIAGFLSILAHV